MIKTAIIKKVKGGKYRLYSKKKDKSGHRRDLGTYDTLAEVKKREKQIQFFRNQHAEDEADDQETKNLTTKSDIAQFLEESGFVDAAEEIYDAMKIDEAEDCLIGPINTDEQLNIGGGRGDVSGAIGGGAPSFNPGEAEKLASIADKLDELNYTEEADAIDDVIKELEQGKEYKKLDEAKLKQKKQKEEAVARSNGLVGNTQTESPGLGGLSDQYFYRPNGSTESNI